MPRWGRVSLSGLWLDVFGWKVAGTSLPLPCLWAIEKGP